MALCLTLTRIAHVCAGMTADVPLYGMAAAERCLEEFDELLECEAEFGSATWHASRRLFDVHRIANMLLASDEAGAPRGEISHCSPVLPLGQVCPGSRARLVPWTTSWHKFRSHAQQAIRSTAEMHCGYPAVLCLLSPCVTVQQCVCCNRDSHTGALRVSWETVDRLKAIAVAREVVPSAAKCYKHLDTVALTAQVIASHAGGGFNVETLAADTHATVLQGMQCPQTSRLSRTRSFHRRLPTCRGESVTQLDARPLSSCCSP